MIQTHTVLKVADNSGARNLRVIGIPGSNARLAGIGDVVTAVVDQADPAGVVQDEEKVRAVIVRTKKEKRRVDGSLIRFDDNAAVVIDNQGLPRGTRIFGPVAREVKEAGFTKIASLATEVV